MADSPTADRTSRKSSWLRLAAIALATIFALAMIVLLFGAVEGEEFSPQTFERRGYHYFEIPLVHLQITPLRRYDQAAPYAALGSYMEFDKKQNVRWDLVRVDRPNTAPRTGDAFILCRYLDAQSADRKPFWLQWSRDHKSLAEVLWPTVRRLAEKQMYVMVPDVFQLAANATEADAFRRDVARRLEQRYRALAGQLRAAGQPDVADRLLDEANSYAESPATHKQS